MPKNREKIIAKGGGTLYIRKLQTGESWYDMGYLSELTLNTDLDTAKVMAGDGLVIDEAITGVTQTMTATLLQTSQEEIQKIIDAKDSYFDVLYSVQVKPGLWQEIYIPLAKIRPKLTLGFKSEVRNLPLEIIALIGKHTTDQTVAGTGGNFTVKAGAYFAFREGTNSIAPVTESIDSVKTKFL
jgi:hypothetical protein